MILGNLKQGLSSECRELILRHGTYLKNRYKREMEFVIITIQDFQKKLEGTIETIDDIRIAMDNLKKFRESEVLSILAKIVNPFFFKFFYKRQKKKLSLPTAYVG